jgi:hypothetical protein
MNSKPTHRAHVVNKGNDGKSYWREIGVVWPHKNGNAFDVVVHEGLSVSGRIVCTEPKPRNAEGEVTETPPETV